MVFSLQNSEYEKIKNLFLDYPHLLTDDFEKRIKKSISVLHYQYLWGACRETKEILPKLKQSCENLFDFIMTIYTKRRKNHQVNFLLLHCFENALRSFLAVKISDLYNTSKDEWFLQKPNETTDVAFNKLLQRVDRAKKRLNKNIDKEPKTTLEIFDCFYMIDLQEIIEEQWEKLADEFKCEKYYKGQILHPYGTKEHLITKISQIRKARNEIFHNKPTKIHFRKDLEILLLRLGFNLKEAINLGDISSTIKLQYDY